MVGHTDEGSTSSDDLENVYDGKTNLESTGSYNVEGNNNSVHQDDRITNLAVQRKK